MTDCSESSGRTNTSWRSFPSRRRASRQAAMVCPSRSPPAPPAAGAPARPPLCRRFMMSMKSLALTMPHRVHVSESQMGAMGMPCS